MSDNDVQALAAILIIGSPVAAWVVVRTMQHRERMEMIKRGMPPPGAAQWVRPAMVYGPPGGSHDDLESPQRALRKGITVTAIGLALTIGLGSIGFLAFDDGRFHPGPWLIGGLIPLFIGLAQVVIALISGATFGVTSGHARAPFGSSGPTAAAPPPPPTFDGSYTYRPDATQELQRPAPPPERR